MRILAVAQGSYFLLTGTWPLVNIASFLKVTGPKHDLWLVKTVGAILALIGAVLILAGAYDDVTPELIVLAIGSAAALAWIDVTYSSKKIIAPIYLADAAAEVVLIALWTIAVLH